MTRGISPPYIEWLKICSNKLAFFLACIVIKYTYVNVSVKILHVDMQNFTHLELNNYPTFTPLQQCRNFNITVLA